MFKKSTDHFVTVLNTSCPPIQCSVTGVDCRRSLDLKIEKKNWLLSLSGIDRWVTTSKHFRSVKLHKKGNEKFSNKNLDRLVLHYSAVQLSFLSNWINESSSIDRDNFIARNVGSSNDRWTSDGDKVISSLSLRHFYQWTLSAACLPLFNSFQVTHRLNSLR